jgi:hypothetical protein
VTRALTAYENGKDVWKAAFNPKAVAKDAAVGAAVGAAAAGLGTAFKALKGLFGKAASGLDEAATLADDAANAADDAVREGAEVTAPGCKLSFGGDTRVLMADGSTKPISEIEVGDEVMATDPDTGETGSREVTATLPHSDQLLSLELTSGDVTTTEDHRFWNNTDHAWQESRDLDNGDRLLTSDGSTVAVVGLDWSSRRTAPAYDLTVDDLHSFYVVAGDAAVLVHNCIGTPTAENGKLKNYIDQLYKHANKPGTVGNGTTMDALREEVVAGAGRHIQKGQEIVNGLRTWLAENPGASYHDRLVAQSLYDELVSIFAGRG